MSDEMTASARPSRRVSDEQLVFLQVQAIDKAGCDWIHVDVMVRADGPSLTSAPSVARAG